MNRIQKKAGILLCFIGGLFFLSSLGKGQSNSVEVEKLIIKNPNGKGVIELGFKEEVPYISFLNAKGEMTLRLEGGSSGTLQLLDGSQPRIQMQGGPVPGIYVKNQSAKTVGSFTMLSDGGGGFGLANNTGNAATILRGGENPSLSFFTNNNEPMAAIGVMQQVPHLLISGPVGNEGVLIHGGNPSSLLVVDEAGKVKILISKHGVFQGKEEEHKKENRVFSFEDKNLFPDDSTKW